MLMTAALLMLFSNISSAPLERKNLLSNSGFEDGSNNWSIQDGVMEIVEGGAHSGNKSLKISWDDPAKRVLAIQKFEIQPGKRYLISAWLKTVDVHGAASGATFGIEWGSEQGYIGGAYPMGVGWTSDWTEIRFVSGVVPKQAKWGHFFTTIDYSGVGTAWVDDVSVKEIDDSDVLRWEIENDSVIGTDDSPKFEVSLDHVCPEAFGEEIEIQFSLCSPPWNSALIDQKIPPLEGDKCCFDTGNLNEGLYKICCAVLSKTTHRILMEREYRNAHKRPPMQCLLDPHSGVLLPGSPWPDIHIKPHRSGTFNGEVIDASGQVVALIESKRIRSGKSFVVTPQGGEVRPGIYECLLTLKLKRFKDHSVSLPFQILTREETSKGVVIGKDNLLYDKGQPWFPMFFYAHTAYDFKKMAEIPKRDPEITADLLDHLQGTPFGLLDYATPIGGLDATVALADECGRRGIRLALSVKDVYPNWGNFNARAADFPGESSKEVVLSLVRRLKDHPALALYYINDELSTQYFNRLTEMRQDLRIADPLHPTLQVHYDMDCIAELAPSYDIWGHELYPWPKDDLVMMANWSDRIMKELPATAPFWGCLWAFRENQNAAALQRALAYLSIAKGARGLLFYSYHDLRLLKNFEQRWKDTVELGTEIESRLPILLQPLSTERATTKTEDIVLRTVSGVEGTWVLAVNSGKQQRAVQISVPKRYKSAGCDGENMEILRGAFRLEMEPFGVKLFQLQPQASRE